MATNDIPDDTDTDVQKFLEKNSIRDEWKKLILEDSIATDSLKSALIKLKEKRAKGPKYVPDDHLILKPLRFKPPTDIKAIIVAHDPVIWRELATGLAVSFPREERQPDLEDYLRELGGNAKSYSLERLKRYIRDLNDKRPGFGMVVMKIALLRAEVEEVGDFNFCYEDKWAKQGVLLWNSALTVNKGCSDREEKHKFWLDFTERLIFLVLRESQYKPVLGMFWGDFAKQVLDKIKASEDVQDTADNCRSYNHPTWPRVDTNNFIENAVEDFRKLKEILSPSGDVEVEKKFKKLQVSEK